MKYLREFNNHAAYEAAKDSLILPNVSFCVQENEVHYKQKIMVVAKFNITDTSSPTTIGNGKFMSGFSSIEIDGVEQPSVVSAYTFSTTGEHTVKYELVDPTTVNSSSFSNCINLTSVDIPNGVTNIGGGVFYQCSGLTSIGIPNSVTSIGPSAFSRCSSLTSIDIPNSVTSIGDASFAQCSSLTSMAIPDSVTTIGGGAFQKCYGLTNITLPSGVTSIGSSTFSDCTSLTSVTIKAITPPAAVGNQFAGVSNFTIYVPAESVDTYKEDSGWSNYSNRIQAIP